MNYYNAEPSLDANKIQSFFDASLKEKYVNLIDDYLQLFVIFEFSTFFVITHFIQF